MPDPNLKLIYGAGQVCTMLKDLLERAEAGRIDGVAIAFTSDHGHLFHGRAWVDNSKYVFARLVTATDQMQKDMIDNGL